MGWAISRWVLRGSQSLKGDLKGGSGSVLLAPFSFAHLSFLCRQMNAEFGEVTTTLVTDLPAFATAVTGAGEGWRTFLAKHAESIESLLQHVGETESDWALRVDSHNTMTVVSHGMWPEYVPQSMLSQTLVSAATKPAVLHHMLQYTRANPGLVIPPFRVLHTFHASPNTDCTASATAECLCDVTKNGVRAFDALAVVLRRLLCLHVPPPTSGVLWKGVFESGYFVLLSAFFSAHGDWYLIGQIDTDTRRLYMHKLLTIVEQDFRVVENALIDQSALSGEVGCTTAEILSNVLALDILHEWVTCYVLRNTDAQRTWLPYVLLVLHREQCLANRSVLGDTLRQLWVQQRLAPVAPCSLPLLLHLMVACTWPLDQEVRWSWVQPVGPTMSTYMSRVCDLLPAGLPTMDGPKLCIAHCDDANEALSMVQADECVGVVIVQKVKTNEVADGALYHAVCGSNGHGSMSCDTYMATLVTALNPESRA